MLHTGEFDDQNGVLRRQADEHYQPDLCIDIVFQPQQPQAGKRAHHGNGRAKQDAERQAPAFILSGQDQEHHQQGKAENYRRGDALGRRFLLV